MGDKTFASWEEAVSWLRLQPDQAETVLASYYDDPLSVAAERYYRSEEWQAVQKFISGRNGRALDVGAGRGIASYALACDGFKATALEPDPSDLVGAGAIRSLATETGLPIETVQEFSERLPFEDATFDVIFARAVLHHTRDLSAACREFARVLKPGGLIIAAREHVISRREDLQAFLDAHPLHHLYGGENAFLLSEYRAALADARLHPLNELAPLRSPINWAPRTRSELIGMMAERVARIPLLGSAFAKVMQLSMFGSMVFWLAALVDNRPGRLYTFIYERPREVAA